MFWYRGITRYVNVNDTFSFFEFGWVKLMLKKMYVYVKIQK